MKIVITDEERQAFMKELSDRKSNDIVSERTDYKKGEEEENFCVEKVIKMCVNKKGEGRVSCEMGWIPSEWGYMGAIEKSLWWGSMWVSSYFVFIQSDTLTTSIIWLTFLLKDEEAMVLKGGKRSRTTSQG